MKIFVTIVLILAAMGYTFTFLYDNRATIVETMRTHFDRYCDAWTACDEAGDRIQAEQEPFEVKPRSVN